MKWLGCQAPIDDCYGERCATTVLGREQSFVSLGAFTATKEVVELDFSLVSPHQWVSYKLKWRRAFRTMSLRRRSDSGGQPSGRIG